MGWIPTVPGMVPTGGNSLAGWDWAVLTVYLIILIGTSLLVARRPKDSRDYFVGHGHMPSWAVALSVLASAMSVATVLGAPQQAFAGNLTYLSANIGTILAVLIVAMWFIPAFYRQQVVTVYELVGNRFGPGAKQAASWTFLLGRMLASGARLFMAAIPVAMMLGGDGHDVGLLGIGILGLAAVSVTCTLAGGIASIIWTDVVQFLVLIVAVIAVLILLWLRIPADAGQVAEVLATAGVNGVSKLTVLDYSTDLTRPYTLLTAVTGVMLLNLAVYGTDQDLAQRMLTCRNAVAGGRSALLAIVLNLPMVLLFMIIGLLLFVFYGQPQLMGAAMPVYQPASSEGAFLVFIMRELPPGMAGLMLAGIFAISLTSTLSAVNAMAATFINDSYRHWRPACTDAHYLRVGRLAVVASGAALALVAAACVFWQQANGQALIDFALGVMVLPYSGLLGVFLCALFTRRGNGVSAIAALIIGFMSALAMQPWAWHWWAATLPLAWPWHMVVGTGLSFFTCCLGRRRAEIS